MNPMMDAIKKKKAGLVSSSHEGTHLNTTEHPDSKGPDASHLHQLVAGLSDGEKSQLKTILDKSDSAGKTAMDIQKGGPSTHEKQAIQAQSQKDDQMNAMDDEQNEHMDDPSGQSSDDIGMSMLDHKSKTGDPAIQPRNLGERVKMGIAQKLKAKGKL